MNDAIVHFQPHLSIFSKQELVASDVFRKSRDGAAQTKHMFAGNRAVCPCTLRFRYSLTAEVSLRRFLDAPTGDVINIAGVGRGTVESGEVWGEIK